jgi:hypothetical protein
MTATTPSVQQPAMSRPGLIGRHPLAAYFAIAFAGTWIAVLPLLLGADGLGLFRYHFGDAGILFAVLGAFTGPMLAALTVTRVTEGWAGVRALFDRARQWRVGAGWYLVALFGFLGIWLAGYSPSSPRSCSAHTSRRSRSWSSWPLARRSAGAGTPFRICSIATGRSAARSSWP